MNLWLAIIDFFASGQRRRGIPVTLPGEEVVKAHRVTAPIKTAITLTQHETGITFDFPMCDSVRSIESEEAWRIFQIGLFLVVGAVLAHAIIKSTIPGLMSHQIVGVPFGAGLTILVIAANRASRLLREKDAQNDNPQQLSVAGNLLVRTSRDQQKQVWYENEIRDIVLTQSALTGATDDAGGYTYNFRLEVWLHNGEIVNLITWNSVVLNADDGPREELEWVTTQLRLALWPTATSAEPSPADDPHANAIRAKDAPREETRYTE